ncbi:hypothetical protein Tco_1500492 [Tanacetum coccineum]
MHDPQIRDQVPKSTALCSASGIPGGLDETKEQRSQSHRSTNSCSSMSRVPSEAGHLQRDCKIEHGASFVLVIADKEARRHQAGLALTQDHAANTSPIVSEISGTNFPEELQNTPIRDVNIQNYSDASKKGHWVFLPHAAWESLNAYASQQLKPYQLTNPTHDLELAACCLRTKICETLPLWRDRQVKIEHQRAMAIATLRILFGKWDEISWNLLPGYHDSEEARCKLGLQKAGNQAQVHTAFHPDTTEQS